MLRFLKVTGNSLFPLYQEGDFVLIIKIPFSLWGYFRYHRGDIVVVKHPYYGLLIKIIQSITNDGKQFFLIGTQDESTDSRQFGLVEHHWILGKVIWHIRNPGKKDSLKKE